MNTAHAKALSICQDIQTIYGLFENAEDGKRILFIAESKDGVTFSATEHKPLFVGSALSPEKLPRAHELKLSKTDDGFFLCYNRVGTKGEQTILTKSLDGNRFGKGVLMSQKESGYILPSLRFDGAEVMFYGNKTISTSLNKREKLSAFEPTGAIVLSPRRGFFDARPLEIIGLALRDQGILLIYQSSFTPNDRKKIYIGAALLSKDNPHQVLWRSDAPLFEKECDADNPYEIAGSAADKDSLFLYFNSPKEGFGVIRMPCIIHIKGKGAPIYKTSLSRHDGNPILRPLSENGWESQGTFNPAALYYGGKVHLFYRALGDDGVSRVGYASSKDGLHFDERLPHPVFELNQEVLSEKIERCGPRQYDRSYYGSGGGWSGSEDPRAVIIDDKVHMLFAAFESWGSIRIGLSKLSLPNLMEQKWDWEPAILLSPKGEVQKNWVLFPEKINNQYAFLHSLAPHVQIGYTETLDGPLRFDGYSGPRVGGRAGAWDNWVRGAGPPPIKTEKGWLIFYHAMDRRDPNRYKLGVMLLDLLDPSKVLARGNAPVLEPDMHYENNWKPGVVYAAGAAIIGETLYVYYGGGDQVTCVATANLEIFLDELIHHKAIHLDTLQAIIV